MVNITAIIVGVIALIVAIVKVVIPLVRSKMSINQWNTLMFWAKIFVGAYEGIIHGESGLGELRREKVMTLLKKWCNKLGLDFDEEEIRVANDEAWRQVIKKSDSKNEETAK